jgi:hypothetical protein
MDIVKIYHSLQIEQELESITSVKAVYLRMVNVLTQNATIKDSLTAKNEKATENNE